MGKFLYITALLLLLSWNSNSYAEDHTGETIILAADVWCPYNCSNSDINQGFVIEIAREIFEPKGIIVQYNIIPWERAIEETRRGTYTGIIGARMGDAPDFIFPEEPIGYSTNIFYVKPGSTWKYKNLSSLQQVSLGVVEGYSYEDRLDAYINNNHRNPSLIQPISGDSVLQQNFDKLDKGHIDALVEDGNVARHYLKRNKLDDKFKIAGEQPDVNIQNQFIFIAFSPVNKNSRDYARMLSQGIADLRKSGKLNEILAKYDVEDWK